MKKKGFTLIELLGVLVLLAVIALIAFLVIDRNIKSGKKKMREKQYETIELAASNWGTDNLTSNILPDLGDTTKITLGKLKIDGYIDVDIADPITGKCLPNYIEIEVTNNGSGKFSYKLNEMSIVESDFGKTEKCSIADAIDNNTTITVSVDGYRNVSADTDYINVTLSTNKKEITDTLYLYNLETNAKSQLTEISTMNCFGYDENSIYIECYLDINFINGRYDQPGKGNEELTFAYSTEEGTKVLDTKFYVYETAEEYFGCDGERCERIPGYETYCMDRGIETNSYLTSVDENFGYNAYQGSKINLNAFNTTKFSYSVINMAGVEDKGSIENISEFDYQNNNNGSYTIEICDERGSCMQHLISLNHNDCEPPAFIEDPIYSLNLPYSAEDKPTDKYVSSSQILTVENIYLSDTVYTAKEIFEHYYGVNKLDMKATYYFERANGGYVRSDTAEVIKPATYGEIVENIDDDDNFDRYSQEFYTYIVAADEAGNLNVTFTELYRKEMDPLMGAILACENFISADLKTIWSDEGVPCVFTKNAPEELRGKYSHVLHMVDYKDENGYTKSLISILADDVMSDDKFCYGDDMNGPSNLLDAIDSKYASISGLPSFDYNVNLEHISYGDAHLYGLEDCADMSCYFESWKKSEISNNKTAKSRLLFYREVSAMYEINRLQNDIYIDNYPPEPLPKWMLAPTLEDAYWLGGTHNRFVQDDIDAGEDLFNHIHHYYIDNEGMKQLTDNSVEYCIYEHDDETTDELVLPHKIRPVYVISSDLMSPNYSYAVEQLGG